jgi:hypothetical protein
LQLRFAERPQPDAPAREALRRTRPDLPPARAAAETQVLRGRRVFSANRRLPAPYYGPATIAGAANGLLQPSPVRPQSGTLRTGSNGPQTGRMCNLPADTCRRARRVVAPRAKEKAASPGSECKPHQDATCRRAEDGVGATGCEGLAGLVPARQTRST